MCGLSICERGRPGRRSRNGSKGSKGRGQQQMWKWLLHPGVGEGEMKKRGPCDQWGLVQLSLTSPAGGESSVPKPIHAPNGVDKRFLLFCVTPASPPAAPGSATGSSASLLRCPSPGATLGAGVHPNFALLRGRFTTPQNPRPQALPFSQNKG